MELVVTAQATINSQATQTYQSIPMAFVVKTVQPEDQVKTVNVKPEEKKMDWKWLGLLNHQINFSLGLIAHATSSRCVNEVIKANVLAHLGVVMVMLRRVTRGSVKYASIFAKHCLQFLLVLQGLSTSLQMFNCEIIWPKRKANS